MTLLSTRLPILLFLISALFIHPVPCQFNTTSTPNNSVIYPLNESCPLPLQQSVHGHFMDTGCGLYCDDENTATPWTTQRTNEYIHNIFVCFLVAAFVCNMIFSFNNFLEHRVNEEGFDTTPITYDALFDAIDANPSTGTCYISQNEVHLLLFLDIIPAVIFIIISILCVRHASKQLQIELDHLISANSPSDDLVNLIHRLKAFLIITLISSVLFLIEEVIWWLSEEKWSESTTEWIECAQNTLLLSNATWSHQIGDECIEELKDEDYYFPSVVLFIAFPITVLLSNIAIITLTCHKRHTDRYRKGTLRARSTVRHWGLEHFPRFSSSHSRNLSSPPKVHRVRTADSGTAETPKSTDLLNALDRDNGLNGAVHHNSDITPMSPSDIACTPMSDQYTGQRTLSPPPSMKSMKSNSSHTKSHSHSQSLGEPVPNSVSRSVQPIKTQTSVPKGGLSIQVSADSEDGSQDTLDRSRPLSTSTTVAIGTGSVRYHPKGIHFDSPSQTSVIRSAVAGVPSDMVLPEMDREDTNGTVKRLSSRSTTELTTTAVTADTRTLDHSMDDAQYAKMRHSALQSSGKISLEYQSEMLAKLDSVGLPKSFHLQQVSNASLDFHNLGDKVLGHDGASLRTVLGLKSLKTESVKLAKPNHGSVGGGGIDGDGDSPLPEMMKAKRSKTEPPMQRQTTEEFFLGELDSAIDGFGKKQRNKKQRREKGDGTSSTGMQRNSSLRSVRFKDSGTSTTSLSSNDDSELALNKRAAALTEKMLETDVVSRAGTDFLIRQLSKEAKQKKREKQQRFADQPKTIRSKSPRYDKDGRVSAGDEHKKENPRESELRRMSHDQKMEMKAKQLEDRHKKGFYHESGDRKLHIPKWGKSLKSAKEFKTSSGESLHKPNRRGLLRPLTMESVLHIETDYFEGQSTTSITPMDEAYFGSQSTFEVVEDAKMPTMQWNDNPHTFMFSLTDADFQQKLHHDLTPHTHRKAFHTMTNIIQMTPESEDGDEEHRLKKAMSTMVGMTNETLKDIDVKHDRSVTGLGYDGRIVLSDIGRFKRKQQMKSCKSEPLPGMENAEIETKDERDTDHDEERIDTPPTFSHHRQHTLHGQLLDALPQADRQNLHVTIHSDFSVQVEERRVNAHVRAQTAKLLLTLKPVTSMKILM